MITTEQMNRVQIATKVERAERLRLARVRLLDALILRSEAAQSVERKIAALADAMMTVQSHLAAKLPAVADESFPRVTERAMRCACNAIAAGKTIEQLKTELAELP